MHKVHFYRDKNGNEPVAEYIAELAQKRDKDSRIKLNKIKAKRELADLIERGAKYE